jgi:hypothetical protein
MPIFLELALFASAIKQGKRSPCRKGFQRINEYFLSLCNVGHVSPEAQIGGPIALLEEGDRYGFGYLRYAGTEGFHSTSSCLSFSHEPSKKGMSQSLLN